MKKSLFIIAIGLLYTLRIEAKVIQGQIIFENDTMNVLMKIPVKFFSQTPNYQKLQTKVKYFDSTGEKKVLRPDDAKEIRFTYNHDKVRMLSRKNTLGFGSVFSTSSNIFLRIIIDGDLKLFYYHFTKSSPGMYNAYTGTTMGASFYSAENYVLQKGNEVIKKPNKIGFRRDMINYFSDCPELSKKIEEKEFRNWDLKSIVIFYNSNCN